MKAKRGTDSVCGGNVSKCIGETVKKEQFWFPDHPCQESHPNTDDCQLLEQEDEEEKRTKALWIRTGTIETAFEYSATKANSLKKAFTIIGKSIKTSIVDDSVVLVVVLSSGLRSLILSTKIRFLVLLVSRVNVQLVALTRNSYKKIIKCLNVSHIQ